MQKRVLSLLVDNTAGVTTRVSGLFSRRGYELMMIKVAAKPEQRQGLISIADVFHAKVADVSVDSMILEMTGNHNKLEAFLELMGDYEILELARTGMTGLSRGSQDVTYF